jgi:hypothetical protein
MTVAYSDKEYLVATKRFRLRYTFWLNLIDPAENLIAERIEALKADRTFAKTMRDGIRLICNLRAGRLDVLFELFPWVKAEFLAGVQPQQTAGELALQQQLTRLEKLLTEQINVVQHPSPVLQPVTGGGPRALNAPKFDLPRLDDDDSETLVVQRDTSTDSALNFLNSMLRLQQ